MHFMAWSNKKLPCCSCRIIQLFSTQLAFLVAEEIACLLLFRCFIGGKCLGTVQVKSEKLIYTCFSRPKPPRLPSSHQMYYLQLQNKDPKENMFNKYPTNLQLKIIIPDHLNPNDLETNMGQTKFFVNLELCTYDFNRKIQYRRKDSLRVLWQRI